MQKVVLGFVLLLAGSLFAAEKVIDFDALPLDQAPPGFTSAVTGEGKPGEWKVITDEVPALLQPLDATTPATVKKSVLGQFSRDKSDEHFPVLIHDDEVYGDFTLTTRFKIVGGEAEQMAGIAFRVQDEKNYYVLRASALGNSFYFYKFINGVRYPPVGSKIEIPTNVWHDLQIECNGTAFRVLLNGKEAMPTINDTSFAAGKIGFWTKSDSVSYFGNTKIVFKPREPLAASLVRQTMKTYPRLLGLKIYTQPDTANPPKILASNDEKEVGNPGGKPEADVIQNGKAYHGKEKDSVSVTLPLRDRNGDPIAAVKVVLDSFPGQTQDNALIRAQPIVKGIQQRVFSIEELSE